MGSKDEADAITGDALGIVPAILQRLLEFVSMAEDGCRKGRDSAVDVLILAIFVALFSFVVAALPIFFWTYMPLVSAFDFQYEYSESEREVLSLGSLPTWSPFRSRNSVMKKTGLSFVPR